jgi:hypothetical protein
MLNLVDARIAELTVKLAGDKLDIVVIKAEDLMALGKKPERALADALEAFKLV